MGAEGGKVRGSKWFWFGFSYSLVEKEANHIAK